MITKRRPHEIFRRFFGRAPPAIQTGNCKKASARNLQTFFPGERRMRNQMGTERRPHEIFARCFKGPPGASWPQKAFHTKSSQDVLPKARSATHVGHKTASARNLQTFFFREPPARINDQNTASATTNDDKTASARNLQTFFGSRQPPTTTYDHKAASARNLQTFFWACSARNPNG